MALSSKETPLQRVNKTFGRLSPNKVQPFFAPGDWQLYHLVEWILKQTGSAEVFVSSFSVSEEFIRALHKLKASNIESLSMLIDYRTAAKALRLSLFTNNVCDMLHLGNNHSKIILVKSQNWMISVVTSQNQTRGNRFEAGMLSTLPEHYTQLKTDIEKHLKTCINANELFKRTAGAD